MAPVRVEDILLCMQYQADGVLAVCAERAV